MGARTPPGATTCATRTRVAAPCTDLVTETFTSRGHGDFLSSHDLEDVLNIIDGREELIGEMANAPNDLRQAVAGVFRLLSEIEYAKVVRRIAPI